MSVPMRWEEESIPDCPLIEKKRLRSPRRKNALRIAVWLTCGVALCTLTVAGAQKAIIAFRPAPELRLENEPTAETAQVALGSATVERRLGFVTITGDVASRTTQELSRVEAVVELRDAQNHTLRMENALIGLPALAPRSSAPFQVELPDDSRAVSYRVRFRQLAGIALN